MAMRTLVKLLSGMHSSVLYQSTEMRECSIACTTLVQLFGRVYPHMRFQVAAFRKRLATIATSVSLLTRVLEFVSFQTVASQHTVYNDSSSYQCDMSCVRANANSSKILLHSHGIRIFFCRRQLPSASLSLSFVVKMLKTHNAPTIETERSNLLQLIRKS